MDMFFLERGMWVGQIGTITRPPWVGPCRVMPGRPITCVWIEMLLPPSHISCRLNGCTLHLFERQQIWDRGIWNGNKSWNLTLLCYLVQINSRMGANKLTNLSPNGIISFWASRPTTITNTGSSNLSHVSHTNHTDFSSKAIRIFETTQSKSIGNSLFILVKTLSRL